MAPDRDLLPAERRLVKNGTLDVRIGDDDADDPAHGSDWPEQRTVRAHVLREALLTDSRTKLVIAGARFVGTLDLEGMTIERSVVLEQCFFDSCPNLEGSDLVSLRLRGSRLADGLNATGCRVRGDLELSGGLCAESLVTVEGASIGGVLIASGGRFLNRGGTAISADGVSASDVFMRYGFEADGEVRLVGARVQGVLACSGGQFRNPGQDALSCDRTIVDSGVFLDDGFSAEGVVRLLGAQIGGPLICSSGRFANENGRALVADRMLARQSVFIDEGFRAEGQLRLVNAQIDGQLAIVDSTIANASGPALDLEGVRVGGDLHLRPAEPFSAYISLIGTHVGSMVDSPTAWEAGYQLEGFRYHALASTWERNNRRRLLRSDTAARDRIAWLDGNKDGYVPQIYDQLIGVYGALGEEAHQRNVLIAKQRRRRGQLPWYSQVWSVALDVLIGFGYRTWQVLIPFVIFLGFGTWFFAGAYDDGDIVPRSTAPTMNVPPFKPFIYSLDQLVPVVNLTQRENWVATGDAQSLTTVMVVVGWILTTALVAALTGLVRRNQ